MQNIFTYFLGRKKQFYDELRVILQILLAVLLLLIVHLFHEKIYHVYNLGNYVLIHLVLEFFSIFVSFFIALQGWLVFPYILSRKRIMISAIFFVVGLFDLLHTLTFQGMSLFIANSTIQKTIWFWLLARLSESVGMLWVFMVKDVLIEKKSRNQIFSLAFFYFLVASVIILSFGDYLPSLFISEQGLTPLKVSIEYFISFLHLIIIILVLFRYKKDTNQSDLMYITAFALILLSELVLTTYEHINDFYHFLGHVYKIIGYYYFLRTLFIHTMEEPFLQKRLVEQNLFKNQQQFRWMLNQIPGAFIAIDKHFHITLANPAAEKILKRELATDQVVGVYYPDLLSQKGLSEANSHILSAMKEKRVITKEKITIFDKIYLNDAAPITDPHTHEVLGAVNYFMDITEEENEHLQREKLLAKYFNQSKNLERLIDAIPVLFLAVDRDGKILMINEKMLHFFQEENKSDVIGKDFAYYTEKKFERQFEDSYIYQALQGEEIQNVHLQVKDFNFLVSAYPFKSEQEEIMGVIALYQDITELEFLRNEIGNLERLKLVGQMAASIAHEIRNPLATIRGFVQLLQKERETGKEYYNIIIEELDRANSIISDFLSLSKNRIVEMEEYNLNDIIKELYPIFLAETNIRAQYIDLDLDQQLPKLRLNKKEIKQLLLNLIRNATEAMGQGGKITISTKKEEEVMLLKIADTGPGIPKEIMDKLFQPFFTTKEGGTGLGLSVSMSIAEKHGATMEVESEEGKGTTFIITFQART